MLDYTLGWTFDGEAEKKTEIELIVDDCHDNFVREWEAMSKEEQEEYNRVCEESFIESHREQTKEDAERAKERIEGYKPYWAWTRATDLVKSDLRLEEWQVVGTVNTGFAMVATERDGRDVIAYGMVIGNEVIGIDLDSVSEYDGE